MKLILKLFIYLFLTSQSSTANADEQSYQFFSYDSQGEECKEPFFSTWSWGSSAAINRAVKVDMMLEEFSWDAAIAESELVSVPFMNWMMGNLRKIRSWEDYERRRQFFFENICGVKATIKRIVPPTPLENQRLGKVYRDADNARLVRSFTPNKYALLRSRVNKSGEIKELSFLTDEATQFERDVRVYLDTKNVVFRMIRTSKRFDSDADLAAFKSILLKALYKKYPNLNETKPFEPSFSASDNPYPSWIDYPRLPKKSDIYLTTADKRYRISIINKSSERIQLIYSYTFLDKELSDSVEFEDLKDVRVKLGKESQRNLNIEKAKQKQLDIKIDKVMPDI